MNLPVTTAALDQLELISDDPRIEGESLGVVADLREFVRASRELRGLLTSGQAAVILGVPPSSVRTWILRGRLTSARILGVTMVSAAEVLAMHRQRQAEGLSAGGRGVKAPSLAALAEEAWSDIDPLG